VTEKSGSDILSARYGFEYITDTDGAKISRKPKYQA